MGRDTVQTVSNVPNKKDGFSTGGWDGGCVVSAGGMQKRHFGGWVWERGD